ncbi:MAG: hypothetical protein H7Y00_07805 [Fimbriimonadaceae bacterium]|nr:hypothetical protein [Chitinophagales bacterium]
MKQLFFAALLTIIFSAKAQIVLEHEYESASTIYSIGPEGNATNSQLMYVNFELSGERYIVIDRWEKEIRFYDMSHVLLSTVSIEDFPVDYYGSMGDFLYFSQNLFDTDDKIEFMYVTRIPSSEEYYTGIYKEDGTLIFSENAGPFIRLTIPTQQYPIYNTSAGTKMILSYTDKHATVFGLPGTLVSEIAIQN